MIPANIDPWIERLKSTYFPHVQLLPTTYAPNSYTELSKYRGAPVLPVYAGACERSIFTRPETNVLFRGVHDCVHLAEELDFSAESESKIADIHRKQLLRIGAPEAVQNAVYWDVRAQIEYFFTHGAYVGDQRGFICAVLSDGLEKALQTKW